VAVGLTWLVIFGGRCGSGVRYPRGEGTQIAVGVEFLILNTHNYNEMEELTVRVAL
jgi:hypothetical protein